MTMTNVSLLKSKIVEAGFTQDELATKMGLSRASINYKVNGEKEFTAKEIYKMCAILEIKDKDPIFFSRNVD